MIRVLFRVIGAALLLAGLVLLARDLVPVARGAGFQPEALGQLWYAVDPGSLNLLQAVIQRYLLPALWDGGVVWLLLQPAFAVALVLGVLLWLVTRPRRRTYYRGLR
jgi:hypothetical protein